MPLIQSMDYLRIMYVGKVKQLWQDKIEEVYADYSDSIIKFDEAFKRLCKLGYEKGYARDSLDEVKQLKLFPDTVEMTFSGGLTYGSARYGKEDTRPTEGKQEQTTSNTKGSSPKDSK